VAEAGGHLAEERFNGRLVGDRDERGEGGDREPPRRRANDAARRRASRPMKIATSEGEKREHEQIERLP